MAWHVPKKESNYVFPSTSKKKSSPIVVPTSIFSNGVPWNFANCFITSLTSICLQHSLLCQHAISFIAPITFLKIRSPSFCLWDIAPRTNNRCLPINGSRTWPKRMKPIFNMRVTVARMFLAWMSQSNGQLFNVHISVNCKCTQQGNRIASTALAKHALISTMLILSECKHMYRNYLV